MIPQRRDNPLYRPSVVGGKVLPPILPPILQPLLLLLMFLLNILILTDHPKGKPRRRSYRPPWKLVKKFRRRCLHLSLVHRCRHCFGQCPCRINGSNFPSPRCTKHCCWRRRKTKAKARHKRRRTVHHEFFLAQPNSINPHLILTGGISSVALDSFCDGSQ